MPRGVACHQLHLGHHSLAAAGVFRRQGDSEEKLEGALAVLLGEAPKDELTSFEWRQSAMDNTLIGGRSYTFIERNAGRKPMNLWSLDPAQIRVGRKDGKKLYVYREGRRNVTYRAAEVIDIPWRLESDGLAHISPINRLRSVIGLAIALESYASRISQNGGVPPLQQSPGLGLELHQSYSCMFVINRGT